MGTLHLSLSVILSGKGHRKYESVRKGWRIKIREWVLVKVKTHFGGWEKRQNLRLTLLPQNTAAAVQLRAPSFNSLFSALTQVQQDSRERFLYSFFFFTISFQRV